MSGVNKMSLGLTPKYMITEESKEFEGCTVYRIRALKDFGNIKAGTLGGWANSDTALSHQGNCWIADDAIVIGPDNRVSGDAIVSGSAVISGGIVLGTSIISGNARVNASAIVYEASNISGNAIVSGESQIKSATIKDFARVCDSAIVRYGAVVQDSAVIRDNADVTGNCTIGGTAIIRDSAKVYGEYRNKDRISAKGCITTISGSSVVGGQAMLVGVTLNKPVVVSDYMLLEDCELSENPAYIKGDGFALTVQSRDILGFMITDRSREGCILTFKERHDSYEEILTNVITPQQIRDFTDLFNSLCVFTGNTDCKI